MVIFKELYTNIENLAKSLTAIQFNYQSKCTVELYTACFGKEEAVSHAKAIKKLIPNCQLTGSSASGVIYNGEQCDRGTLIIIKQYEKAEVIAKGFSWENDSPEELVHKMTAPYMGRNIKMINLLFSDHYPAVYEFVEEFKKILPKVAIAGGVVGDILPENIMGYVFTEEGIIEQGAIFILICGDEVHTYTGVNIANEPISPVYTITKTDGSYWDSIDGIHSVTWFKEHLGIEDMKQYDDWDDIANNDPLVWFLAVLEGHNGASRYVRFDDGEKRITQYFSMLPENTKFRISYMSPNKCVKRCQDICGEIVQHPIEDLFAYSCLFRKLYMKNCAQWELAPYKEDNVCGMFMMGEIGNVNGENEFLNGACVLSGVAEKKVYLTPDSAPFSDLYKIEDENKGLLNYVLKRQSESISSYNQELLDRLLQQQKIIADQINIDPQSKMYNLIKYKSDTTQFSLDKLCMIQVENVDTLYRYLGQAEYIRLLRKTIWKVRNFIRKLGMDEYLSFYMVNDSTFVIAAGQGIAEKQFINAVNSVFENYQYLKVSELNISIISRFVVIMYEKKMIEKALYTLQINKDSQKHYILWSSQSNKEMSTGKELRMVNILKWALENNGIVAHYHGIHDNAKNRITKYEALMRVVDENGVVYPPFEFMGIAKKYHLYSQLSTRMVETVFKQCSNKDMEVSINLSAFDIESEEFCNILFQKIRTLKKPQNMIFEILEDESFASMQLLEEFIVKMKSFGVKIAVDDFGSGYSNLLKIARISPDFIKIDGDIIKEVPVDKNNRIILETVVYLAKQLHASLVAEYVENEVIQKVLCDMGVGFSQGFHFAKPVPMDELCIKELD